MTISPPPSRRAAASRTFAEPTMLTRIVDVLENDRQGLNLTWEVRDGIAKHSKGKSGSPVGMAPEQRSSTIEGQIMRVADLIACLAPMTSDPCVRLCGLTCELSSALVFLTL